MCIAIASHVLSLELQYLTKHIVILTRVMRHISRYSRVCADGRERRGRRRRRRRGRGRIPRHRGGAHAARAREGYRLHVPGGTHAPLATTHTHLAHATSHTRRYFSSHKHNSKVLKVKVRVTFKVILSFYDSVVGMLMKPCKYE